MNEEINYAQQFLYGSHWRAPGKKTFAVFNHVPNGQLVTQSFEDLWEKYGDVDDWRLVETAEEKFQAFRCQANVINFEIIKNAENAEEAIAIAIKEFGMKPIKLEVVK